MLKGDIQSKEICNNIIKQVVDKFQQLDILVNNAAVQFEQKSIENISEQQLDQTFKTNIYSM